ncbi:MAG: hypothetical protein JWL71_3574 [Acidobacteria bacterium]|nr:hypothetical protein [Acidobacteriota bacterium]
MNGKIRNRGLGFLVGASTFVGAHALEVAMWTTSFGGEHDPWFLNSGSAAACTVASLFAASVLSGAFGLPGWSLGVGAVTAMVVILARQGGSTIFPLVVCVGTVFIGFGCLLGAWIGKELAALRRSGPDS